MKALAALALLAALVPQPKIAAPQIQVRTTFFVATAAPGSQAAKVDCLSGEKVAGGGFDADAPIRINGSYPGGPSTWIVEMVNPGKTSVHVTVAVACISAADVSITSGPAGRVDCPSGEYVASGGYQLRDPGTIFNNYPGLGNSWVAEGTAVSKAYAVCVSGVAVQRVATQDAKFVAASANCVAQPAVALVCTYPQSGNQAVSCNDGESLSMGGQRIVSGALPPNSVLTSTSDGRMWTFKAAGTNRDAGAVTVQVSAVCLAFAAAPAIVAPQKTGYSWPTMAALIAIPLLALITVVAVILHLRRRPSPGSPDVEAVLTGQRASFRYSSWREIP